PEQIVAVTPTVNPGWDVEKVMEDLAEPIDDGHGGEYTERVAEVVYTAKEPLPDGLRDAFGLSLKLPEAEGGTLGRAAVREGEEGERAGVQLPEEGESEEEHERPARVVVLAAAEGPEPEARAEDVAADTGPAAAEGSTSRASDSDAGSPALPWI